MAGPFGLAAPFLAVAALAAVSVVMVARSTDVPEVETSTVVHPRLAFDLLSNLPLVGALCLGSAAYAMIGTFDVLWDVVHEDLGTPDWLANLGISVFALPLIVLAPFGGRLAQRVGPFRLGGLGLVVAAGFMAGYGLLPSGPWIVGVSMIHAPSDGVTIAATGVAVAVTAPGQRQAGAQGLLGASQALTAGLIAPMTGALYQEHGWLVAYATTSLLMVVLVGTGSVLAWSVIRRSGRQLAAPVGGAR